MTVMDNSGLGQFAWRTAYTTPVNDTFKSFQDKCDFLLNFGDDLIGCSKYENTMLCCKENCVWQNIENE